MHSHDPEKNNTEFQAEFEHILEDAGQGRADFHWFVFPNSDYSYREFTAQCVFQDATFMKSANFCGAKFMRSVNFYGAKFAQSADFDTAEFAETADFSEAIFTRHADFSTARQRQQQR
jgi:uncharacterized protein YjbI with pentapeptide repeats